MPEDWRDQLNAYTSTMLVFSACLPPGFLENVGMNQKFLPNIGTFWSARTLRAATLRGRRCQNHFGMDDWE
jgi:hypothetical protein